MKKYYQLFPIKDCDDQYLVALRSTLDRIVLSSERYPLAEPNDLCGDVWWQIDNKKACTLVFTYRKKDNIMTGKIGIHSIPPKYRSDK